MKTIELETFNANVHVTDTSTVVLNQLVAIEPHDLPGQCRLHLAGNVTLCAMLSHEDVLKRIGDGAPSITLTVWDPVEAKLSWTFFIPHITALTGSDNNSEESRLTLSNGRDYRILMPYQDLAKRILNNGAYK